MHGRLAELRRIDQRLFGPVAGQAFPRLEGERRRRGHPGHSRQRREPRAQIAHERLPRFIVGNRKIGNEERQKAVRIVARLDALQGDEAPNHQPGSHEQHECERDFENHDAAAQPVARRQVARPARPLQQVHHVRPRRAERRHEPEHHRRHQRSNGREHEDCRVDRNPFHSGKVLGTDGNQQIDPESGEEDAGHRRQTREQQALDEQLLNQARTAAAERGTHGKLAFARRRAHEQQVGHVRAGNQHHEADGTHQCQNHRLYVGDKVLVHRLHAHVETGGLLDRKLLAQACGDHVDFFLRLSDGDAITEPADDPLGDVDAGTSSEVDAHRRPDVRRTLDVHARREQHLEPRLEYADHVDPLLAERHDRSHSRGVRAKVALPEFVAEDRPRRRWRGSGRRRRFTGNHLSR